MKDKPKFGIIPKAGFPDFFSKITKIWCKIQILTRKNIFLQKYFKYALIIGVIENDAKKKSKEKQGCQDFKFLCYSEFYVFFLYKFDFLPNISQHR